MNSPEYSNGDEEHRCFPSLTKQDLEQANLNSQSPTLATIVMREKMLAQEEGHMQFTSKIVKMSNKPIAKEMVKCPCPAQAVGEEDISEVVVSPEDCSETLKQTPTLNAAHLNEMDNPRHLVGKPALLKGLVKMPEFNGEWGTVIGYEEDSQRCKVSVQRSGGPTMVAKLRRQNLFIPASLALTFTDVPPAADAKAMWASVVDSDEGSPCIGNNIDQTPPAPASPAQLQQRTASKATLRRERLRRIARERAASAAPPMVTKAQEEKSMPSPSLTEETLERQVQKITVTTPRQQVSPTTIRARSHSLPRDARTPATFATPKAATSTTTEAIVAASICDSADAACDTNGTNSSPARTPSRSSTSEKPIAANAASDSSTSEKPIAANAA